MVIENLYNEIQKPYRVEIREAGQDSEMLYASTLGEATSAINRAKAIAGRNFEFGRVFDESGKQVFEIMLNEFAEVY